MATAQIDRTVKKDLYARVFRTSEYYLYDPDVRTLEGLRLVDRFYQPMAPDAQGRLWSEQLGAFLGLWQGRREGLERTWVRLFRPDGSLVPTGEERAAEAESELARLRGQLEGRE